jgi:mannose-6-phosphate isomerase-like protein (cupin superfamily)
MVSSLRLWVPAPALICVLTASTAWAQAVAGPEKARAVQGDPGISSMVVLDRPEFRILRDYAEPAATRRMHAHKDATYHVFVLITGKLRLTIDGSSPVEVNPGEALYLAGGVQHTFTNTGTVAATIVEVFGKGPAAPGDAAAWAALAPALAQGAISPYR